MSRATARQTLVNRRDFLSICGLAAGSCLVSEDIPSKVIKTDRLGRQQVYRTDRY